MALKDKTAVTYHAGVDTIGGTVVEISYQASHIFFDFGTEYNPDVVKPDEKLQTLIDFREVPELNNVYDSRLDYEYRGPETATYEQTAVFLSHVHLDHTKMINFLDPAIPLYATKATNKILRLLNANGDFLIKTPVERQNFTRAIMEVNPNETVNVGQIKVTFIPVDHDAYGACGLLIETPTARIAYTGDLRLHGTDPELTMNFCLAAQQPDLLIMEGVSVSFDTPQDESSDFVASEMAVVERINSVLAANPDRPAVFNCYPGNIQRLINICANVHKKVVVLADVAELIRQVTGKDEHYYYLPNQESIKSLDPHLEVSYNRLWEERLSYFWQVEQDMPEFPENAVYFHSDAEPFDFAPDFKPFMERLERQHVQFVPVMCSGHAVPADLDKIVAAIKPRLLTPIHSWHPERLHNPFGKRQLVQRGETVYL